jgi:hypothetical protein
MVANESERNLQIIFVFCAIMEYHTLSIYKEEKFISYSFGGWKVKNMVLISWRVSVLHDLIKEGTRVRAS